MTDSTSSISARSTTDRSWLNNARRLVIKIGSRGLVDEHNRLDVDQVQALTGQMAKLHAAGKQIVCVTSAAVAAGLRELGLDSRPKDLPALQAAAAIGQARLVELYRKYFANHDISIGQVLLTHADLRARERHLNARNTLGRLLDGGVVPVINENDTVAVDEIRVGDNDLLSALVAVLVQADALILLTTEDGLLHRPPDAGGQLVEVVDRITDEIHAMAGGVGSDVATGGMKSKIQAAEVVTQCGEYALIANARTPNVLGRLIEGESLGTMFLPHPQKLRGRQRWIAFFDHPRGELHVDDGAARAMVEGGRSLLAIGITFVTGNFERGSPVRIVNLLGDEIGRGLVNYPSEQLQRIQGCRSEEIAGVLGSCEYPEVVHRDNFVLKQ